MGIRQYNSPGKWYDHHSSRKTGTAEKTHINVLELLIIYVALSHWGTLFQGKIIKHLGDNTTANRWANKGRASAPFAGEITIAIVNLQRNLGFRVDSHHIKGKENTEADELSRVYSNYVLTRDNKRIRTKRIDPNRFLQDILDLNQSSR